MNEEQNKQNNLIGTTDCLEAVGVFRGWKNFLFIIVLLCLALLQTSFWLVDTGCIKTDDGAKSDSTAAVCPKTTAEPNQTAAKQTVGETDEIQTAAKQVTAEPNQADEAAPQKPRIDLSFNVTFKQLAWLIRFLNFVLIPTAILYCLTMLFSLKVSMLGRLGGINHIARAFFLSLAMLVLLLPWQRFFAGVVVGVIYTPQELLSSCTAVRDGGTFSTSLYYLRFTGYWLLVLLLLVFSQLRSIRWAKAILRRLEVI